MAEKLDENIADMMICDNCGRKSRGMIQTTDGLLCIDCIEDLNDIDYTKPTPGETPELRKMRERILELQKEIEKEEE